MKKLFAALVVALFTPFAFAENTERSELDFLLGVGCIHKEKRADGKPWNERNLGFAVQYIAPGTLWGNNVEYCATAGTIKNSEFGQTVFFGGCVRKNVLEGFAGAISIGAFAGVMTYPSEYNKERGNGDMFPVVLPTISACLKNGICLDTTFIPKVQENQGSAAILFMGRFPIDISGKTAH